MAGNAIKWMTEKFFGLSPFPQHGTMHRRDSCQFVHMRYVYYLMYFEYTDRRINEKQVLNGM